MVVFQISPELNKNNECRMLKDTIAFNGCRRCYFRNTILL
jgi:hypothetical protein